MADAMSAQDNAQTATAILAGLKTVSMNEWMTRVMPGDLTNISAAFDAWNKTGNQGYPYFSAIGPMASTKLIAGLPYSNQAAYVCFLGGSSSVQYTDLSGVYLYFPYNDNYVVLNSSQWNYNQDARLLVVSFSTVDLRPDGTNTAIYTNDLGINVIKVRVIMSANNRTGEFDAETRVYTGGVV